MSMPMKHGAAVSRSMAALVLSLLIGGSARADFANPGFDSGTLSGWTTYTTSNGSIGTPAVSSFDTSGLGASNAAKLSVGVKTALGGGTDYEGGGLSQSLSLDAGTYTITFNFATYNPNVGSNSSAGIYAILMDAATLASTNDLGAVSPSETIRGSLTDTFTLATAGTHLFDFQVTRPYLATNSPNEYFDDMHLTSLSAVPVPPALVLFGSGIIGLLGLARRRVSSVAKSAA